MILVLVQKLKDDWREKRDSTKLLDFCVFITTSTLPVRHQVALLLLSLIHVQNTMIRISCDWTKTYANTHLQAFHHVRDLSTIIYDIQHGFVRSYVMEETASLEKDIPVPQLA